MELEVRRVKDVAEFTGGIMAIGQYFGMVPTEERMQRFADLMTFERMHAAWADGTIVGGAGAFDFNLTVPGGELPTAGVTVVGVSPTHRRRGVLRALMRMQLDEAHERGDPLAALWASEETIYGRFGSAWRPSAARSRSPTSTPRSRSRLRLRDGAADRARGGARGDPAPLRRDQARLARDVLPQSNLVGAARDRRS